MTTWTKVTKPANGVAVVGGSPIGLLLALTTATATSTGTSWTKVTKAAATSWTKTAKAT